MKHEQKALLLGLVAVSIAFAWVIAPYLSAIFWAIVLAVLFAPLYRWLLPVVRHHRNPAALATLLVAVAGVGVPVALVMASLLRQAAAVYADMALRRIDFGAFLQRIADGLPRGALAGLDLLGLGDLAAVRERLTAGALTAARFVTTHLLGFGLDAVDFAISLGAMAYVFFFLLRDGAALAVLVQRAIPLRSDVSRALLGNFASVIRATVKGGVAMAAAQGALGGAMLGWLGVEAPIFWGVVFGLLSMLPAVGASLLWVPIATYFMVAGVVWKGVVLTIFGTVVLTAVDNFLRPVLVGRDTQLPGYLILVSTLGGVATSGLSGVVVGPVIAATFVAAWNLWSAAAPPKRP